MLDETLNVSVRHLASEAERGAYYERLVMLTGTDDLMLQDRALSRLRHAFQLEKGEEREEERSPELISLPARLESILASVERQMACHPDLLERFCCHFSPSLCDPSETALIRDWLNRLEESELSQRIPVNTLLAVRIYCGAFGTTWQDAGERLLTALDHEDLNVRACAAYQIGTFCCRLAPIDPLWKAQGRDAESDRRVTEGMAPLIDYWTLIQQKEIQRPGLAGAFWTGAPTDSLGTEFADEWILTLIEQAEREPYLPYFPCNIGFEAHQRFSRNPPAVRRLMSAGRLGLASEAASDANKPVEGMEPLLMELGESDAPEVVRLASWTLAYYYRRLHPNGERNGFVQQYTEFPDSDLFLLFSERHTPGTPYAVVLYPKSPRRSWTLEEAATLVDRVFPPGVRGNIRQDEYRFENTTRYRSGYVDFVGAGKTRRSRKVARITIGYRSDAYWNPIPV